jgi:hypothetical protein
MRENVIEGSVSGSKIKNQWTFEGVWSEPEMDLILSRLVPNIDYDMTNVWEFRRDKFMIYVTRYTWNWGWSCKSAEEVAAKVREYYTKYPPYFVKEIN